MMSNKPHLRPHQKKRQASPATRLLVAILILAACALAIALEVSGRVLLTGRLVLSRGAGQRRRPAVRTLLPASDEAPAAGAQLPRAQGTGARGR
jgi:hypothetical protein